MKKLYELAEEIFEIDHMFLSTYDYMKEYEVFNVEPKFIISYTLKDLATYKKTHDYIPDLDIIENVDNNFIYYKVNSLLALSNKFIIHASSIYLDSLDNAYLFVAPSGTGKSTHTRLLKNTYQNRVNYINDDKPFIYNDNGTFYLYGGPWNGKSRISNNVKCKLKGIFVIEQGHDNNATRINPSLALNYLIKQIFMPTGEKEAENALKCLIDLSNNVPVYILNVDMSIDAAKASYKIMNSLNKENN